MWQAIEQQDEIRHRRSGCVRSVRRRPPSSQISPTLVFAIKESCQTSDTFFRPVFSTVVPCELAVEQSELCTASATSRGCSNLNFSSAVLLCGAKFYDTRVKRGGGGAVDLVMHRYNVDFKGAVAFLRRLNI